MNEQWGGLTIQPASSDALTAEIEKVQRHVEAQGTRRNSTPPVAYDEAYTQVVDDLADEQTLVQIINDLGEPVATDNAEPPKIQQRYRSHVRNRSRRERARQRHLPPPRASSLDPAVVAERKDLLEAARSLMPPEDWALFEDRSLGYTFAEIARRDGGSPEALRQRASRRRAALKYLIA